MSSCSSSWLSWRPSPPQHPQSTTVFSPNNFMGDYTFVQIFLSNASSCNRFNYGCKQLLGKLLPISEKRTPQITQECGKARGTVVQALPAQTVEVTLDCSCSELCVPSTLESECTFCFCFLGRWTILVTGSSYQVWCELLSFGSTETKITMSVIGGSMQEEHLLILNTTKNVIPAWFLPPQYPFLFWIFQSASKYKLLPPV